MSGGGVGAVEVAVGIAVVVVAAAALVVPRRLASAVGFLVFGVLLSVLWALAGAPDVALAEAAIGAGVTGVLFVETVTRSRTARPGPEARDPDARPDRARPAPWLLGVGATVLAGLVLAAAVVPALWRAARPLDGARAGLSAQVAEVMPATGVEHEVTGVLLNLRSYDTLLEIAVLLVAVLAVLAVSRPVGTDGGQVPGSGPEGEVEGSRSGASPVPVGAVAPLQRAMTVLLVPVLLLLAAWILFAGATRTGGAFQAGAVLAALVVLLHLAQRPVLPPGGVLAGLVATVGLLAFVAVALIGPATGRAWLELDPSWAGTLIVVLETLLTVAIGASLALIALALRGEARRPRTASSPPGSPPPGSPAPRGGEDR